MESVVRTVLIVGAGQAGAAVAFELRSQGFQGRVVLVGAESHLPYERPQLSKEVLQANGNELKLIRGLDAYQDASIELHLGLSVVSIDAVQDIVVLSDGAEVAFDRLVIASGVRPRDLPGLTGVQVTYLRTVEDALALRHAIQPQSRIAIIGGGVIGLEVASAVVAADGQPVVIEAGNRLMARSLCERTASFLDTWHRQKGVDIRYGVTVNRFEAGILSLSNHEQVEVDHVLVCVGVEPNHEPFVACGITGPQGVLVDAFGRTANPKIYATGDIAVHSSDEAFFYRVETWEHAQSHAELVARNVLGAEDRYRDPVWFWSDQGALNLQVVGTTLQGQEVQRAGSREGSFSIFRISEDGKVLGCTSINAPKDMAMARRWLKQDVQLDQNALADASIDLRKCVV
ncbi:FAD-dependent oxidoreductase [Pseudomonas aeruginosa]|nr:FAD-dependent oxidoreductase [Pseudomonas aeruginosa]